MHIVILGCGRVGSGLAGRLDAEGHSVSVIDRQLRADLRYLSPGFGGLVLHGTGFKRSVLEAAGLAQADAFVAVTAGDNTNIVGARVAREEFRVPKVVARIYDPRRADIYRDFGIPTVAPVRWTINQIHQLLTYRNLEPDLQFGNGETVLVRSSLPEYLKGRPVLEFNVDGEIQVVEVTRAGRSLIAGPGTLIEAGDLVSFAVASSALTRLRSFLNKGFE